VRVLLDEQLELFFRQTAKSPVLQAVQKDLRGEAREKSTSGGVLFLYVDAKSVERNEAYESFSAAR
jgi:hypothetical protein